MLVVKRRVCTCVTISHRSKSFQSRQINFKSIIISKHIEIKKKTVPYIISIKYTEFIFTSTTSSLTHILETFRPWGTKDWTMQRVNRPTPTHTVCSCKPDGPFEQSQKKINHNTFCPPFNWIRSPCTVQSKHPAASCSTVRMSRSQPAHSQPTRWNSLCLLTDR